MNIYRQLIFCFKHSIQFCKITLCLLYSYTYIIRYDINVCSRRRRRVNIVYLTSIIILALLAVGIITLGRNMRRRKALEQLLERYQQSREALLRYVMLNRQCSEESAYKRLAVFMKSHAPIDEYSTIDMMLASNRQRLIDMVQDILASDPNEIDKI